MKSHLAENQQKFMDGVFKKAPEIEEIIKPNGKISAAQHMQVYRNNVRLILTDHFKKTFPVLSKLVGENFINQLSWDFIKESPPKDYDLFQYGENLPDFLKKYPPADNHPYLADVTRLEWAREVAWRAADAPGLHHEDLAKARNDISALSLSLHPSCSLLESPWPVGKIWQANQEGFEGDEAIDLESGPCYMLISRPKMDVLVWDLTKGEHHFLKALAQGHPFGVAAQLAQTAEEAFNDEALAQALAHHLSGGTFTDFTIKET